MKGEEFYQAMENPKNNRIDYIMPVYKVIDALIKYFSETHMRPSLLREDSVSIRIQDNSMLARSDPGFQF